MVSKKIGRNDLCWCGSRIKYKKCHLNRHLQEPIKPCDAEKQFRKEFSQKVCSAPNIYHKDCTREIVQAHTVPRSSSLKSISRNGHVYGLNLKSIYTYHNNNRRFNPVLIGLNNASTFTGFCKFHDDKLFSPLEKGDFQLTDQTCFLLAYRALSREMYTKKAAFETNNYISFADRGRSIDRQIEIQTKNSMMKIGLSAALKDFEHHKKLYDNILTTRSFEMIRGVSFEVNAPPPVMVSGGVNPDYDFTGNSIQDIGDLERIPDFLTVTSFFDGKIGRVLFAWIDSSHETCEKLLNSLLSKDRETIPFYVMQYIFKNFENYYMQPDWWESLSNKYQKLIIDLMYDTINPDSEPNGTALSNPWLNVDFPKITRISPINWVPVVEL